MKKPPKSNGLFPACLKFDLKMKLSLLFFVTASFVMQASISYSQKTKISLNKESVTVKEVIDEIETTTEFKFLFNTKSVDLNRRVSLNVKKVPVNTILDLLFKGTDTSYEIDDRKILLTKTKESKTALIIPQPNLPDLPTVPIKGTIVDSNGQPLPSANVVEKGTKTGVTTDFDGKFALNVSNENAILIVSYIGFDTQEVSLKGQTTIKVVLKESAAGLNEVVVVGYGTQKKHDITGSVSSINKNSIKDLVLTSTEQALKGQAAGVQMTQSSSAPGGGASVRIRGGNSISAGNEPLYVIDGFPIYNDSSNSTGVLGNGQPTNVLASINPSDIESMEILKDASATAIYGARGANGVIIITTKRGKAGQTSVTFETYYGFQQLSKKIDLVNAYDFAKNANVDNIQRARPLIYPDPEIYNPAVYGQGTDWQDEAFRVAPTQNYQLGFTGGNEQTKYAISGNYFTQDGILRGSDFTRGSVRVNLDQNLSSKFKLGLSFTASRTANNQAKTDTDLDANNIGAVTSILYAPPTAPVYAADGSYNRFIGPDGSFYGNPVASLLEIKNLSRTDRVMGNIFLDYKITKDLVAKVSFGGDQINVKDDYYMPAFIQSTGQNAKARIGVNQSFSWLNENTLTYTKTFAEKHNFTALGGFTRQKFTAENVTTGADKFVNDVLGDGSLGTGAIVVPPTSNVNEWALESYIARINYGYNNRYLVTLTGRADGSSRFGESNKFSFFPSGSFAWRASEEEFMKSQKIISNLKFRVSYGQTGNTEIPTYRSLAALGGTSNYPIGGVITSGVASTRVANPNLKWETTSQFDGGIDLSLFANRINFVADYYDKRTEDLLLDVQIPGTSGYQTSLQNVGSVRNHGVELALNTVNFDGEFKWKTSFNITFNKNEVTDLGGDYERPAGGGSASKAIANTGILRVGEPVGLFYGYLTDGLFQTPAEVAAGVASGQAGVQLGDRRYKDVNGDGKLDANDRTILGYAQPDFFYGMTNTFSYKNFDLNVLINGVQGNDVLNLNVNAETDINAPGSNNRWTPTNTNTDVPRTTKETRLTNKQVEDGSYLRIQNISFGYEMPKIVFKNTFVQSIRLYVSLQNYFTFTNYKGYNPDVNSFGQDNLSIGVDRGGYPAAKTFLMGLNVKL